jgi:hypothetical protein
MIKVKPHTILHAIKYENVKKLDEFSNLGLNLSKMDFPRPYDNFLQTILMLKSTQVLNFYIEKGYDLNPKLENYDEYDEHLLMKLIHEKKDDEAIQLINLGIDINKEYNYSAFSAYEYILKGSKTTPLAFSLMENNINVMNVLIAKNAQLNPNKFDYIMTKIGKDILPQTFHHFLIKSLDSDFMSYIVKKLPFLRAQKINVETLEFVENIILKQKLEMNSVDDMKKTKRSLKI